MAFLMADASNGATTSSIGAPGAGLGAVGIPGIGVGLDTSPDAGDPTGNEVYIFNSANGTRLASTTSVPNLRDRAVRVTVTVRGSVITVYVDGVQILSITAVIASTVLVGYSAGNGPIADWHGISDSTITS
jgi:hypothetical protein